MSDNFAKQRLFSTIDNDRFDILIITSIDFASVTNGMTNTLASPTLCVTILNCEIQGAFVIYQPIYHLIWSYQATCGDILYLE